MPRAEPADFTEFMHARWSSLFRTAYLLTGNPHDAEELLQDALARTCVKWRGIRDKGAADGYVRRILVHEASRGWRRRAREQVTDEVPLPGSGGGLVEHETRLDVWREICLLPPRMRAVLVLRYYEDLTETDTAAVLGCSVGTVKSQSHAAIKRLRSTLGDPVMASLKGES
jgi:RNA polymerase sigma-70 factor (sigma-E family)